MTDYSNAASVATETVNNFVILTIPARGHKPLVEWEYPEFQCLCPVSGRHDQGVVRLQYEPQDKILESKSVRDYLMQWRNKRAWQEYVTDDIAETLFRASSAKWLIIKVSWASRGGITAKTIAKRGIFD